MFANLVPWQRQSITTGTITKFLRHVIITAHDVDLADSSGMENLHEFRQILKQAKKHGDNSNNGNNKETNKQASKQTKQTEHKCYQTLEQNQ